MPNEITAEAAQVDPATITSTADVFVPTIDAPEVIDEATDKLAAAVDEAIAEAPAKIYWTLDVKYVEGVSDEDKAAAEQGGIIEFAKEVGASPENHLPACIEAVIIRRFHAGE